MLVFMIQTIVMPGKKERKVHSLFHFLCSILVIFYFVYKWQSGGEASIVAELVEVEENDTQKMQTIRAPPIITINKSAAYALYELTYIRVKPCHFTDAPLFHLYLFIYSVK